MYKFDKYLKYPSSSLIFVLFGTQSWKQSMNASKIIKLSDLKSLKAIFVDLIIKEIVFLLST